MRWSPHMYRSLVRSGIAGLTTAGHGDDELLLGETAPIGKDRGARFKRSIGPVDFYRELFCLDDRGRKLSGRAARIRGCSTYKRLEVTGVAHHPYTSGAGQRPTRVRARGTSRSA